ncbi:hypothetical protein MTO96_019759 [Rhipicephalus appendiculatus]
MCWSLLLLAGAVARDVASSVQLLEAEMRATTGVDRIASSELPNVLHGVPELLVRKALEEATKCFRLLDVALSHTVISEREAV